MASSVGLKVTQDQVAEYRAFKANASTRLASAQKIDIACAPDNFALNTDFFEANRPRIEKFVKDMAAANGVIEKLVAQNGEAGTCKVTRTQPGRFFGTRNVTREEGLAEVNAEIQSILKKEPVVVGLRTLGIIPTPKAPIFKLPEAPSGRTVAKAAAGLAATAGAGAAYVYRNEIGQAAVAGYEKLPQSVKDFAGSVATKAGELASAAKGYLPGMPTIPSMQDVKTFAEAQYNSAKAGLSDMKDFVVANPGKVAAGVGVAALVIGGGVAAYKVVQNRKKEAQEAAVQAAPAPVADQVKAG